MTTMNTSFSIKNETPYTFLKALQSYENTEQGLAEIAEKCGMNHEDSVELAESIISGVQTYDIFVGDVKEDTQNAMRSFFKAIEKKTRAERVTILNRVAFNLEAFRNPYLIDQMEKGISIEELFEEHCGGGTSANTLENELDLQKRVLQQVGGMNVSPKAVRQIAKKLKNNESFASNSAFVGKEYFHLKCANALYVYLDEYELMHPETACIIACTQSYMASAAATVQHGKMTEKVAAELLKVVVIAAVIAVEVVLMELGVPALLVIAAVLLPTMLLFCLAEKGGEVISVKTSASMENGINAMHEGFRRIAGYMKDQLAKLKRHETKVEQDNDIVINTNMDLDEDLDDTVYVF